MSFTDILCNIGMHHYRTIREETLCVDRCDTQEDYPPLPIRSYMRPHNSALYMRVRECVLCGHKKYSVKYGEYEETYIY